MKQNEIDTRTEHGRQQIRREIAERLGWKLILDDHGWSLFSPDGIRKYFSGWVAALVMTEDQGWLGALSSTECVDDSQPLYDADCVDWASVIPDWPNDPAAAYQLPQTDSFVISTTHSRHGVCVEYVSFDGKTGDRLTHARVIIREDVPSKEALAWCLAWLDYDDQQRGVA